jgi:uncharacterized protein YcnI
MRTSHLSKFMVLAAIVLLASAHVTVTPRTIRPAGGGDFTIRVPTEKPVPTVKLRVEFPQTLRVSRLKAKPGWTAEIEKDSAGVITAATWSGGKIAAFEYDEFMFSGRTRETAGELVFKAYQTYEGGEVVPWSGEVENRPAPRVVIEAPPSGLAAVGADRWMSGSALLLGLVALTMIMRNGNGRKRES